MQSDRDLLSSLLLITIVIFNMNRKLIYLVLVLGLISGSSCKKSKLAAPGTEVQIRVQNAAAWMLYDCTVDPAGTLGDNPGVNAHSYGDINVNTFSDYYTFKQACRYSWFRLTMNSKLYYLKPFDYTGEALLGAGKYTYKITYIAATDRLNLELIKD